MQLPNMQPLLEGRLEEAFAIEVDSHNRKDGELLLP